MQLQSYTKVRDIFQIYITKNPNKKVHLEDGLKYRRK